MVFTRRQSRVTAAAHTNISALQFPATPTKIPTRKLDVSSVKQHQDAPTANLAASSAANASHDEGSIAKLKQQVTPKQAPHVKPSRQEMHPQLEKKTITTPKEASQWLGFFKMQPQTEPRQFGSKLHNVLPESPTPVKTMPPVVSSPLSKQNAPSYAFTFRRESSVQLSAEARKIMEETRAEASLIRAKLAAEAAEKSRVLQEQNQRILGRKIAQPKGRFSDVHSAAFNRMDSIANHPSAWRATAKHTTALASQTSEQQPLASRLKRSRSKADIQVSSSESDSQATDSASTEINRSAKRVRHDTAMRPRSGSDRDDSQNPPSRPLTTMRKVQSALYTPTKSSLARSKHTVSLKKTQIPALVRGQSASPLKTKTPSFAADTTVKTATTFMSPTKTSLQRVQEHQWPAKSGSATSSPNPPSRLGKVSPATPLSGSATTSVTVATPTPGRTKDVPMVRPLPQPPLSSPQPLSGMAKIKSILRTPLRHYSSDPAKIAAGTHMATPPSIKGPAAASVVKHVVFSASARLKAARDEAKAISEEPEISYPLLPQSVPHGNQIKSFAQQGPIVPGDFTFRAGNEIKFGSPLVSTIRAVRSSDQSPATQPLAINNKRKIDHLDDSASAIVACHNDDKENSPDHEHRPSKRVRQNPQPVTKITQKETAPGIATSQRLARKTPSKSTASSAASSRVVTKRSSGLTASRLAILSLPKKR